MESEIKITKLNPGDKKSILKIAHWYFEEWETPIDKTINRLSNQPSEDTIFQLIATLDNEVVATGGLCDEVNLYKVHARFKEFKPWVALLYTHKDCRNQGLGQELLTQIECCAKEQNLNKIYLYTFTAESLYKRCGWKVFERVPYKNQDTAVMEKVLSVTSLP